MANKNTGLNQANTNKKDEFYTQHIDIQNELRHYKDFFEGKTVYCNCDDPYESEFFKYFALNFNKLKLKKLISISYASSPVAGKEFGLFEDQGVEYQITGKKAYKVIMVELKDVTGEGGEDLEDVKHLIRHRIRYLKGNGDFRSEESIELLKQADVVVTNPPFSMFREFVAQLIEYDKKFIIIGNQNAITYKEIFPLLQNNKMWLGYGFPGNVGFFKSPYQDTAVSNQHIEGMIRVSGVMWFTNIDTKKRHEEMLLFRHYTPEEYPKYDNFDAIEVSRTKDIPCDYYDIMGVPITYMQYYNPDQFDIVGNEYTFNIPKGRGYVNGKRMYSRIFIRRHKNED